MGLVAISALAVTTACSAAAPTGGVATGGAAPAPGGAAQQAGGQTAGAARQGGGGGPAAPVAVASVQQGAIRSGPTFSGDIVALQQINLAPRSIGTITRLAVGVGEEVAAGQVVAELDRSLLDVSVMQAQAGVESAQARLSQIQLGPKGTDVARAQASVDQQLANLDSSRSKLDALMGGAKPQDIDSARAALDIAQAKLDALRNGPRPEQRVLLQKDVEKSKNDLWAAQTKRDGDCGPRNPRFTCDAAMATVAAAETAVNKALLAYELAIAPPTATDLSQARDAVIQAQAALDKQLNSYTDQDLIQAQAAVAAQDAVYRSAVAALEAANSPFTDTDYQVALSALRTAQAQLETARVNQQQAYVTAPFTGIISARLLGEGALTTSTIPIYTLVSKDVGIDLPVAQEMIGQLSTGMPADIRTPALPGGSVAGLVASIAPAADPRTRAFSVRVVPEDQDGRLRPGMSASVTLATASQEDAILIPTDAIVTLQGTAGQGVFVVEDRAGSMVASFKAPTFGVASGKMTQILGGLNLGDMVVVQGQAGLTNNQGVRLIGGPPASAPRGGSPGTAATGAGQNG